MKTAVLILGGLLLAGSGRAQALRGAFYTVEKERGFSSDLFVFAGNRFFYQHGGCLGIHTGEGTYQRRGKRLILLFEHAAADTMPRARPLPGPLASTSAFRFRVTDSSTGAGLPGVDIISQVKPGTGTQTDQTGTAFLFPLPMPGDKFQFRYIGYDPVVLAPSVAPGEGLEVRLGPPYYYEQGDTLTFQIQKSNVKTLVLKPFFDDEEDAAEVKYGHHERITLVEARRHLARTQ